MIIIGLEGFPVGQCSVTVTIVQIFSEFLSGVPHMPLGIRRPALLLGMTVLAAACDNSSPVTPSTTGSLTINIETVGGLPDPDGYRITRTGAAPVDVAVNASLRLDSLAPGTYSFALDKASLYCGVEDGANRDVQVVAGRSTTLTFRVRCEATGLAYLTEVDNVTSLNIMFPGRAPTTLATGVGPGRVMFSPDRRRIVYSTGAATGAPATVKSVDLDSLAITQLTPTGAPGRGLPAWSPDGTRIVYVSSPQVRTLRIGDTSESTVWEPATGVNQYPLSPVWSPDGTRIAFVRTGSSIVGAEIVVVNADGSGEHVLTRFSNIGYLQIDWSPDGKSIVYQTLTAGGSAIRVVDVASGQNREIVTTDQQHRNPIFLPDGRIGFFVINNGVPAGNWTVNMNGTELTQVQIPGLAGGSPITAWQ